MASKKNNRRRRRGLFVAEIIILVVLSVALFAAVWVTHKLSLVNYDTDFDRSQVKTSTEYNQSGNNRNPNSDSYTGSESTGSGQTDASADAQTTDPQTAETQTPETQTADTQVADATVATPEPTPEPTPDPVAQLGLPGIQTIALVGIDTRQYGSEGSQNSDTMMVCVINHNDKTIKLASLYRDTFLNVGTDYYGNPDYYFKANSAYNLGGPEQFLTMLNLNFDLDITQYVTVDFRALAYTIELLGGLDIDLTYEELVHVNNYNVETAANCDLPYVEVVCPDDPGFAGAVTRTFHLNGTQAVSYARIRYTDGYDFRRASRQRLVLQLLKEKAKQADIFTLNSVLEQILPYVTTNIDAGTILTLAPTVVTYSMTPADQIGFPQVHVQDNGYITGADCVLPVTLWYNAAKLHQFLYPGYDYWPSDTVTYYSNVIAEMTGYGDAQIPAAEAVYDDAYIPAYTDMTNIYGPVIGDPNYGYYDEYGNWIMW